MADDLNDIYQLLGSLAADVKNLRREIEQANRRVDARLDPLPAQLAEIARRTDHLESGLAILRGDLADDVLPVVQEVRAWKQRGIGALAMAGMGGGAIGLTVATGWHTIWNMVTTLARGG